MHRFLEFDPQLNIARLPLTYSLGDPSSIRGLFTPDHGDIGRTQLPILPPKVEEMSHDDGEIYGYLVETSPALVVAIKEFLKGIVSMLEYKTLSKDNRQSKIANYYAEVRRECINRVGIRLVEVIKQERRLGLYNLFWLMISKHLVTLLDQVIPAKGDRRSQYKIAMQPVIAQTFQETFQKVQRYLRKEDEKKRRYSPYIGEILTSHLGAAFNYEFFQSIISDQIHLLFPNIYHGSLIECAQSIFITNNEKYHITYAEFVELFSGFRSYIEGRLRKRDEVFCDMIASVLKIPPQKIENVPIETLLFHPIIISLFAEEIKQLPVKPRKKTLFKSWSSQLVNLFGEESWEFAMNDFLTFAKDLRRSEIVSFLRNRVVCVRKTQNIFPPGLSRRRVITGTSRGIADKISYQFDKGRIINDLRSVTLIFLDLRGFTELSASDITDQALKEHLYTFFDPVVNIVNHFGGTIRSYAGDAILASFDPDSQQKNHALDAVRAALEIQKVFKRLKQEGKMAFKGMGIGIHSGLVEEAYFFTDPEASSYNTVIGLAANLVGRLSSGKAERRKRLDIQAAFSLHERLISSSHLDSSLLTNIENQLLQALEALQQEEKLSSEKPEQTQELAVTITKGILNNQGIAISGVGGTFERIRSSVKLKEIEFHDSVHYTFFDNILREQIVFIKAGDASFKGIDTGTQGKIPVWGVYLERDLH
jgi:class 3 adenylate cyclase